MLYETVRTQKGCANGARYDAVMSGNSRSPPDAGWMCRGSQVVAAAVNNVGTRRKGVSKSDAGGIGSVVFLHATMQVQRSAS